MSVDPTLRLYAQNAADLARKLAKAEATGKRVGGYDADQLRLLVAAYRKLAGGATVGTRRVRTRA